MGLKIFGTGGIDQKSNDLKRNPEKLRNAINMMATSRDEYSKRPGTDVDTDFLGDTYSDVIFIKSLGEYFFWDGSDYVSYKNGVRSVPYTFFKGAISGDIGNISLAEYLNTAIFTHTKNPIAVATYDGNSVYKSGLPTPLTTITGGSGSGGYVLTFFEFIDAKGNIYYGPSTINDCLASGTIGISYTTLKDTGFFGAYLNMSISTTPITIDALNRAISYVTKSPDIMAGSLVVIRNRGATIVIADTSSASRDFSDTFVILKVESIVGSDITFTEESIGSRSISIGLTFGGPIVANIHGATSLRLFFSTSEVTGYTCESLSSLNGQLVDNTSSTNTGTYSFNADKDVLLSDIYDITTSKLRPPPCRFISTYGYQIVCGGVVSFFDFQNKENTYSGNDDLIMYSDLSTGDLGVNFSELNRQLIGDTYDGQITGMDRVKDSLIVFKDSSAYSLDGLLIPDQYSMRKIETDEIGCLSNKSILQTDGGVIFQGQDGLYVINGYNIKKLSAELDPFFSIVDPRFTRSVVNNLLDQYLFWTDKGIAVYDYHFNQWYIWDNIQATSGITVDNQRSIRFFSSSGAVKFIPEKNDSGIAIDGSIETAWFDLGEPSILKKITDIRLFAMKNIGQDIEISISKDWDANDSKSLSFRMETGTLSQLRKIDISLAQSFSFRIRNNIVDENLNISGYDVVCQEYQTRDKNVK